MAGVSVEEDDRGVREEDRDEEVPHHPACGGEPEDPVSLLGVHVEMHLLQVLQEDASVALDDGFREPGGAGGVEDPERVVEGNALELGRLAGTAVFHFLPGDAV